MKTAIWPNKHNAGLTIKDESGYQFKDIVQIDISESSMFVEAWSPSNVNTDSAYHIDGPKTANLSVDDNYDATLIAHLPKCQ